MLLFYRSESCVFEDFFEKRYLFFLEDFYQYIPNKFNITKFYVGKPEKK